MQMLPTPNYFWSRNGKEIKEEVAQFLKGSFISFALQWLC